MEWNLSSRRPYRCPYRGMSCSTAGCPGGRSCHLRTRTSRCPRRSCSAMGKLWRSPARTEPSLISGGALHCLRWLLKAGRIQSAGWLSSYLSKWHRRRWHPLWRRRWGDDVWKLATRHTRLSCIRIRMTRGFSHASKPVCMRSSTSAEASLRSGIVSPWL